MTNVARTNVAWTNIHLTIVLDCPELMDNSFMIIGLKVVDLGKVSYPMSDTHTNRQKTNTVVALAGLASWGWGQAN